jgi:hypothetical protein
MTCVSVFVPGSGPKDHIETLSALAKGAAKDPGNQVQVLALEDGYEECDVAVVFGFPKLAVEASYLRGAVLFEHRFRRRKPVVVIERGFIHRSKYYGVGLNGLNGLADFRNENCPPDRWEALGVDIRPRVDRPDGYHLLCGQVPWDASVQHTDHVAWCQTVHAALVDRGFSVRFRPHPDVADYDYGLEVSGQSWEEDLAGAKSVITMTSTSSALAVLEGLPIFAVGRGSIAWEVAMHEVTAENLTNPHRPDCEQWAHNLAYTQWTLEEMADGLPWQRLFGEKT